MSGLRIVTNGPMSQQARVLYQPCADPDDWFADAEPIDLSASFTGCDVHLQVGEVVTAELRAITTQVDLEFAPRGLAIRSVQTKRKRWWR